jgi:putative membrane protein
MDKLRFAALLTGLALAASASAQDQKSSTPGASGADEPSAASSPHQRQTTTTTGPEAPTQGTTSPNAAASPHQHEATQGKHESVSAASPADFVKKASLAGMTEVQLAKAALEKSQNPAIRTFAERMIADHGKAQQELATIAKKKGLTVPAALDTDHQQMVQSMGAKSGAAFDSAYAQHMKADHAKAVSLFTSASSGQDAELATFARTTLPTLKEHKKLADALPTRTAAASP